MVSVTNDRYYIVDRYYIDIMYFRKYIYDVQIIDKINAL